MGKEVMYVRRKGEELRRAECPHCGGTNLRMVGKGLVIPDAMEFFAMLFFGGAAMLLLSEGVLSIMDRGWIMEFTYEQMMAGMVPIRVVCWFISHVLVYMGMRNHILSRHKKDGITVETGYCRRCEWVYRMRYPVGTEPMNCYEENGKPKEPAGNEPAEEYPEE